MIGDTPLKTKSHWVSVVRAAFFFFTAAQQPNGIRVPCKEKCLDD